MTALDDRGSGGRANRRLRRGLLDEARADRIRRGTALRGSHTTSGWRGRFRPTLNKNR